MGSLGADAMEQTGVKRRWLGRICHHYHDEPGKAGFAVYCLYPIYQTIEFGTSER